MHVIGESVPGVVGAGRPGDAANSAPSAERRQLGTGDYAHVMNGYADLVVSDSLRYVTGVLQAEHPGQQIELIGLGCGPGGSMVEFCANNPSEYPEAERPFSLKLLEADFLETIGTIPDNTYDIAFSGVSIASNQDPDMAVAEQLRITRNMAVFAGYDWTSATIRSADTDIMGAGLAAISTVASCLEEAGLNTEFGSELHDCIEQVAAERGYDVEIIRSLRYNMPDGDNRELLLGYAGTVCAQLQAVADNPEASKLLRIKSRFTLIRLGRYMDIISRAPGGSMIITLPTLCATIVRKRDNAQ